MGSMSETRPDQEQEHQHPRQQQQQQQFNTLEEISASAMRNDGEFDDDEHDMEIAPGQYVKFRGAQETWKAVASNQTVEVQCLECAAALVCIDDCEYTVCPDCR